MALRFLTRIIRKKRVRLPVGGSGSAGLSTTAPGEIISIRQNPATGSIVYLPTSPVTGKIYAVKDTLGFAGGHPWTLRTLDGSLIDGAATYALATAFGCVELVYDGTGWIVLSPVDMLPLIGTNGGIPAYTGPYTLTSSGVLAANAIVIGGGVGAAPSTDANWTFASHVLTGNFNAAAATTPTATALLQLCAADATTCTLELNAFAQSTQLIGYRANNTNASQQVLTSGQTIFGFGGQGYDGTSRTNNAVNVQLATLNNWSHGSDTSTVINFRVTPSGSTTLATHGQISAQGCSFTGSNTNDSANAGQIGEYASAIVLIANEVSINAAANVVTLSLTAGDWDVSGELWVDTSTGAATVSLGPRCSITTTSATLTTVPADGTTRSGFGTPTIASSTTGMVLPTGPVRISLNTTTNVYLVGVCSVSAGTAYGYGKLSARRKR